MATVGSVGTVLSPVQLQELKQAESMMRATLVPPGKMGQDILSLNVAAADWKAETFNVKGDIARSNMYGERNVFHFNGLVSLKDKLVSGLKETFAHSIPR